MKLQLSIYATNYWTPCPHWIWNFSCRLLVLQLATEWCSYCYVYCFPWFQNNLWRHCRTVHQSGFWIRVHTNAVSLLGQLVLKPLLGVVTNNLISTRMQWTGFLHIRFAAIHNKGTVSHQREYISLIGGYSSFCCEFQSEVPSGYRLSWTFGLCDAWCLVFDLTGLPDIWVFFRISQDSLIMRFLCTPYDVCCVVLCSFVYIPISVWFRL